MFFPAVRHQKVGGKSDIRHQKVGGKSMLALISAQTRRMAERINALIRSPKARWLLKLDVNVYIFMVGKVLYCSYETEPDGSPPHE